MKKCFKCLTIKELKDFYKHPEMSTGFLNKCKDCVKKDSKKGLYIKKCCYCFARYSLTSGEIKRDRKFCCRSCMYSFWYKNGHPNKGNKLTEEHKNKLKNSHLGKKVSSETIKKHRLHKHTAEARIKMSLAHKKIRHKHHNWKGGITPLNKQIRQSLPYKLWRESVFKRDNYTCQNCGIKNGNGKTIILNADHIKPFAQFTESRFDINNGQTLCISCHRKTNTYGYKNK